MLLYLYINLKYFEFYSHTQPCRGSALDPANVRPYAHLEKKKNGNPTLAYAALDHFYWR